MRVAILYAIFGFGAVEVITNFSEALRLPERTPTIAAAIVLIGYPIALAVAWAFPPRLTGSPPPARWRKLLVVGFVIGAIAYATLSGRFSALFRGGRDATPSIAVLPFQNIGGGPENEYFTDGMTEDVIAQLTKIGGLKVISRTSVMSYKGTKKSVREIADELGVSSVLEGSVRREDSRLRVVAQLIDARADEHLWADTYDRELKDVFAIQSDVAQRIAQALHAKLSPRQVTRIERKPTEDVEAYQLFLKGRQAWNRRTPKGLHEAIDFFQRAIARDDRFALAWAALADVYVVLPYHHRRPITDEPERARAAASRALEIDPEMGEAHAALANVYWYEGRLDDADHEFRRALELNPGYATAHQWSAELLAARGDVAAAEARMARALELDPHSLIIRTDVGTMHYYARRFDDAIARLRATLDTDSTFAHAWGELAKVYELSGRYAEALDAGDRARTLRGEPPAQHTAQRVAFRKQPDAAHYFQLMLAESTGWEGTSPVTRARWHVGLGEKEAALHELEEAVRHPDALVAFIGIEPAFEPLYGHPRFKTLREKLDLE
jgi:TolB-like protein/Flp pilus assembly protein TadD